MFLAYLFLLFFRFLCLLFFALASVLALAFSPAPTGDYIKVKGRVSLGITGIVLANFGQTIIISHAEIIPGPFKYFEPDARHRARISIFRN